jgi:hypothetical protein
VLDTAGAGTVFVKGLPLGHPGAVRQQREAAINPYVRAVAPALLWHDRAAGWDLLAFEYLVGPGTPTTAPARLTCHGSWPSCTSSLRYRAPACPR